MRRYLFLFALLLLPGLGRALEVPVQTEARLTGTAVTATDYTAGYLWQQGALGTLYGPYAGFRFKQKLYDSFLADVSLHVFNTSSSDNGVYVYLDRAEASWQGPWLTLAGGRREVGAFFGPSEYFGAYSTMGQRTVDMVSATLPFRLFADVPDADATLQAPYNALSILYIPDLLSAAKTQLDGKEGLILGQVRVKFGVGSTSSDLILNYSQGLQDYFQYSTLSRGGSFDGSYAFSYKFARVWGEYAIQDFTFPQATSVATAGLRLDIHRVTLGLFSKLQGEYQIPLGTDPGDPFAGGNAQNPTLAINPQNVWFAELVHKTNDRQPTEPARFFYGAALTNSIGDYTLARLVDGSISAPVAPGYGAATRVQFLPLSASSYSQIAGTCWMGYEF